ncbi:MAG: DNA methyltransferase [Thermodesulfobacteriota bacterium]
MIESEPRLVEADKFAFEFLSAIALRESWRKEIYRPIYHLHKWWAKRLGSVFRGILLGCLLKESDDLEEAFYRPHDFGAVSVFDPFMGSGTTVGEAHKLGCVALGQDINPVACESVRVAFGPLNRYHLQSAFNRLSSTVGERIRGLYKSTDEDGRSCDVLYYFWVKQVPCPECGSKVDLFNHYLVARNAYPDRKPDVQVLCPRCGDIFRSTNGENLVICDRCQLEFAPRVGTASGARAICSTCSHSFSIARAVRSSDQPPAHRLYGKLLLTPEGHKRYLPATAADLDAYDECSVRLRTELERGSIRVPQGVLKDGYNTRQALSYNYRAWHQFFNDRQLLALGWLHQAIAELSSSAARDALLTLFSGLLEFNNLFASYKGEGTGAVRHMFSHHILKPERTPIEANVWGTPKSSGCFSNLFRTRLLRALEYRADPFEVAVDRSGRVYACGKAFSGRVEERWPDTHGFAKRGIYLSCHSSHDTRLPDSSIDLVVTDPPFFDNVHYSELADFFYSWEKLYPHGFLREGETTRNEKEVQDSNAQAFARKLKGVFAECHRVLKEDGLLVFTYHHSRVEGWASLISAVFGAGFTVVNAHPVKAEMSVATPKSQAKEPIQLDVILVCVKRERDRRKRANPDHAVKRAIQTTCQKISRLESIGLKLSENDRRVTLFSQFISELGPKHSAKDAVDVFNRHEPELESAAREFMDKSPPVTVGLSFKKISDQQISLALD